MALDNKHPLYTKIAPQWEVMRDAYAGEDAIKLKGVTYLPPTCGMVTDGLSIGQPGLAQYEAYKMRAVFPGFVTDAVEAYIGTMHTKDAQIKLPAKLEFLRKKATLHGESLQQLLRYLNEQQLVTGRVGMLLDLPKVPDPTNPVPYIVTYTGESILNWDEGLHNEKLNLVVLKEDGLERNSDFGWTEIDIYRVLTLGDPSKNEAAGTYRAGVFRNTAFVDTAMLTPSIRGTTLTEIPFVFVNTTDTLSTPDTPALMGLARLALTIYRGEADYRQNLFMQGQDTFVVIGGTEENARVGAGALLALPQGSDAKYVGVNSEGLSEQRQALENDRIAAAHKAGQLLDTASKEKESGSALRIRVAAQTATLRAVALSGAVALERILKIAATWVGANPDEVSVTANLDFVNDEINSRSLMELVTAKTMGAPLSNKTIHEYMEVKSLTKLDYETELEEIENEEPLTDAGTDAGGNPADDVGVNVGDNAQNE